MATLKEKLPRYCVIRKRKGYAVVYFSVPKKLRPPNWEPTYEVGRTDKHSNEQIIERGKEFYQSLKDARKSADLDIPRVRKGSFAWLIQEYKKSEHWLNLRPETHRSYQDHLNTIRLWSEASGHPHVSRLTAPTLLEFLNRWQDAPRTRKYYKAILSKLYQIGFEKSVVEKNLAKDLKLPKSHKRKKKVKRWLPKDIDAFALMADEMGLPNVGTAVIVAWESFRQTDVFHLQEPRDYTNGAFVFNTSKTDEEIRVRASQRTVKRLSEKPRAQLLLTVNDVTKRQWTRNSFYNQYRKVCEKVGLKGYDFRHIRNSAAMFAEEAGLTDEQLEQRFGWSRQNIRDMKKLYTDTSQDIIDKGADKLAALEKLNASKK